jgi:hypothetical protein
MNMIKIGSTVLNIDRINGVLDHFSPDSSAAPGHRTVTRVLFDQAHIDLTGTDAKTFRHWYRHVARDISPHRDEEGQELISPEEQVRRAFDVLLSHIDHAHPRDPLVRSTAHHVSAMLDRYITGELEPIRATRFARLFAAPHPDAQEEPDSASS